MYTHLIQIYGNVDISIPVLVLVLDLKENKIKNKSIMQICPSQLWGSKFWASAINLFILVLLIN